MNTAPRFNAGSHLGPHAIRKFLGNGPFGERYEVFFGSTNHLHCLVVPPIGAPAPDFAALLRLGAPLLREPCLVHLFAAGETNGIPWLRAELSQGAPEWAIASPLDPELLPKSDRSEGTSRDGKRRFLLVPTLADLIRSAGPEFAAADRNQFLGDVFEGLAALHAAGLPCGHLAPEEIDLDRFARTRRAVARLRFWGEGAGAPDLSERLAADLRLAAGLVRFLATPPEGRAPSRLDTSLAAFAGSLESGALATAAEAKTAYEALLRTHGFKHQPHHDPDAVPARRHTLPPDPEPEAPRGRAGDPRRRVATRRAAPTGLALVSAGSEVARQSVQFLRGVGLIASIAAVGIAVFFGLRWHDERQRLEHAIVSPDTYNSVTIVPLSLTEAAGAGAQVGLEGLFDMPADLLAAEAEAGNALAISRLALENALARTNENAVAEASARLKPLLPALHVAASNDLSAAYLEGYAQLLGLGAPAPDPAAAYLALSDAAARGSSRASLLIGDWFASDYPLPAPHDADSRLARDREALARYRAAGGVNGVPTPLWWASADRITAVLRRASSVSDFADDYGAWLRASAAAGHIPSMAVLSEPGPFAPTNPADSLEWLRRINNYPDALPWVRAWAQVRMANMFSEGRGAPRSDSSARLWYERAAQAGNRNAMLALAEFCDSGRGRNDARPDPAAAALWRSKAADAEPEPSFAPHLLPLSLSETK